MEKQRFSSWRMMAGIVMILLLTSLACNLSVDVPDLGQVIPTQPSSDPTRPIPRINTPSADQPESTPAIPGTGQQNPGELAEPVSEAPANLEELYTQTNQGVVSILTQVTQGGMSGGGAGSGFVLTDNGYIVTNHHVIEGASMIIVRFYNNADIEAELVGDDPNSDLAIIRVDRMAEGAHPLPLGDSSQTRVGDSVVAIGNPFSLGTSMSAGIVSAVGRTIPSGFTPYNIPQAIQTDAAINPGNSGGPLINMRGEVIGINAQIRTGSDGGGNVGIGFAIPVNILKQIYPSLIDQGFYAWSYLGVGSPAENPLSLNTGDVEGQRGALIATIEPGGPADQAGIQEGDVVIQAEGEGINSFDDLLTFIAFHRPGEAIRLVILRNGEQQEVSVTLGERPRELLPSQ